MTYATINGKLTKVVKQKKQDSREEYWRNALETAPDLETQAYLRTTMLKELWETSNAMALATNIDNSEWNTFEDFLQDIEKQSGLEFMRIQ
jgi:hypothetical protein